MEETLVVKENNEPISIEVLLNFKIDKIGKNYIIYTINENENEVVLTFYEKIKNAI